MFPKIFAVVAVLMAEVVPVFVSLVAAGHGAHQDLGLVVAAHVGAEVLLGGEGPPALLTAELLLDSVLFPPVHSFSPDRDLRLLLFHFILNYFGKCGKIHHQTSPSG